MLFIFLTTTRFANRLHEAFSAINLLFAPSNWSTQDTLSYPITCVLPLLPQLTSTVGVSGGLSNFLSFTFLSFLPGRPSSPLINSLKKTDITPLSRVLNKKQLYSTPKWLTCDSNSSAWTSHSPVSPHPHSPRMPGHKASPATWSSSGHGPSCPHCKVKERNHQSQKATSSPLTSAFLSKTANNICSNQTWRWARYIFRASTIPVFGPKIISNI